VRIVHFVPWLFLAPEDGGRIKTGSLASALAACGELHVIDLNRRPWEGRYFAGEEVELPFGRSANVWSCIPQQDVLHYVLRRIRSSRRRFGGALARRLGAEVAVADDISTLTTAFGVGSAAVIAHTHNVESVLHRELTSMARHDAHKSRARAEFYADIERRCLPQADEIWGVRESDLDFYRGLGAKNLRIVPNTLPAERFAPPTIGLRGHALFFGSLWWAPNREAVEYLTAMVARLGAAGAVKGLQLQVAGRGADPAMSQAVTQLPIQLLGFVPDLKALVRNVAAVLIPVLSGGGTKIKTIEALALGKPVVTTPEGAAGLGLQDGIHARVCDPGPDFDTAAIEVLNDPERFAPMAVAGQRWVLQHFSQSTLDRVVSDGLEAVAARRLRA
jgi:glycosyltransferase involved in cell wall biosynthesis